MEGLKVVADLFRPGKFMCNLVLKDAYFTVPLHSRSQKFNHFQFQGKIYQFNCLPFGLSSAPRIFTKKLNPVTGIPKKMGIPIIIYLDDMLILNSTLEGAREDFLIKLILGNLGFLINIKKIHIYPRTGHRIPGNHRALHKHGLSPPRRESCCNSGRVSPLGKQSSGRSKSALSYNRKVDLLQNYSPSSPPSLSQDPTFEEQQHAPPGTLYSSQQCKNTCTSGSSYSRGSKMVGR